LASLGVVLTTADQQEKGKGVDAPVIIPLGDLALKASPASPGSAESQALPGLAQFYPDLSLALKRLERLGKALHAINNNFKDADRSAPPLNLIWKQIHDYIRLIITCVFRPSTNLGPRELVGLAAQMAAGGEKQLALQSTSLPSQLVGNVELESSMKLIEEVEQFLYDEIQGLIKTQQLLLRS
jgi:hypothetical protein